MGIGQDIARLIQCHKALPQFNYDVAVDWAIDLLRQGTETENVLILASFTKPADLYEVRPYVTAALRDLRIEEKEGDDAVRGYVCFRLQEIIDGHRVRENLYELKDLYTDLDLGLSLFYFAYFAWKDLEEGYPNFYLEGAGLGNIEQMVKEEAKKWILERSLH